MREGAQCLPEVKLSVLWILPQFVSDAMEAPLVLHLQTTTLRDPLQQHRSTHTHTDYLQPMRVFQVGLETIIIIVNMSRSRIQSSVPAVVPDAGDALQQVSPTGGDHLVGDLEQQRGHSL